MTREQLLKTAREIYEKTQCNGVGCCGDINGALEFIDSTISELVDEAVDQDRMNSSAYHNLS